MPTLPVPHCALRQVRAEFGPDSVDQSKKEKSDAEINSFGKKAGGIIAKVNGIEIKTAAFIFGKESRFVVIARKVAG